MASAVLFVGVAAIALVMARSGLTARRLLPFHQAATALYAAAAIILGMAPFAGGH